MGMFDEFRLRTPYRCPGCSQTSSFTFQTKEFDCLLEEYVEGRPAVQYKWEYLTEREYLDRVQKYDILCGRGGLFIMSNGEPWYPWFHKDSKTVASKLKDGEYSAYRYCKICKDMYYITAIIKNGIFIGIKEKRGMEI